MRLLTKHKKDYKELSTEELLKIVEEEVKLQKKKSDRNVYVPLNSVRNNNRRAFRKFFYARNKSAVSRAKAKEKLAILKGIRDSMKQNKTA